jgi:decaprenylphospho-beta-D-ribofuranose 2-oxidase
MKSRKELLYCYGRSQKAQAECLRPEGARDLQCLVHDDYEGSVLGRGRGLSYSDVCLNKTVILSDRLNHFIDVEETRITAQPGVTLSELFFLYPAKSLAVIPGTLRATLGGAVANDIHGKNNSKYGNMGHHLNSIQLVIPDGRIKTSPDEHADLFFATIGGLGLTGFIEEVNLNLCDKSKFVRVKTKALCDISELFNDLQHSQDEYAVCWLDMLNHNRFLLMEAEHISRECNFHHRVKKIPFTLPFNLVREWNMKWFNKLYFKWHQSREFETDIVFYNNPLDTIYGWDRVYGPRGLVQFQCVFPFENAEHHYQSILKIIDKHDATPVLAVLKKFTRPGLGLLSFTQAGFSLAIDFANTTKNGEAIRHLNEYITEIAGTIYLAKDSFLTKAQFESMYKSSDQFKEVLEKYKINSKFASHLSTRLGITA